MNTITDRIEDAFREAKTRRPDLTQAELARLVGVERQTVGDWFKGRSKNITPDNLYRLSDALGVEARWLATGKGSRTPLAITAEQRRLLAAYARLPAIQRETLKTLIEQIAEPRADYS